MIAKHHVNNLKNNLHFFYNNKFIITICLCKKCYIPNNIQETNCMKS